MVTGLEVGDLLPTCGCGDPESVVTLVHWTLAMFKYMNDFPSYTGSPQESFKRDILGMETRFDGLYWAFLGSLYKAGLIEHGSTISFSWLTGRGESVLQFLDRHGCDMDVWPTSEVRK